MDLALLSLADLLALQSELRRARATEHALFHIAWHAERARECPGNARMARRLHNLQRAFTQDG